MRPTWPGARSGNISITTFPLVVSRISVFSGSLISAISNSFPGCALVGVRGNPHLDHAVRIVDRAVGRGAALRDVVHQLHAALDLADDGVLAIEVWRRRKHDEELRIGGVRVCAARHSDDAALEPRRGKLRLDVGQL